MANIHNEYLYSMQSKRCLVTDLRSYSRATLNRKRSHAIVSRHVEQKSLDSMILHTQLNSAASVRHSPIRMTPSIPIRLNLSDDPTQLDLLKLHWVELQAYICHVTRRLDWFRLIWKCFSIPCLHLGRADQILDGSVRRVASWWSALNTRL